MRMMVLFCLLVLMVSACTVPPVFRGGPTAIREQVFDPNKRYYIDNGVSFLPPALPGASATSWDYQAAFNVSYETQGIRVTIAIASGTIRKRDNFPDKELFYKKFEQKRNKENQRRADILAGTLEEQWQKKLAEEGLESMMEGLWIGDEESPVVPFKLRYKTPEAQEKKLREDFFYFFGRKRDRLRGLPDDTSQRVTVNNWDCIQTDSYQRLGTPLGEYATKLGGGIEHYRNYACYLRADLIPSFSADVRLAPGAEFDIDAALKPILDSITIDETLPANHTTFQMMKAAKK